MKGGEKHNRVLIRKYTIWKKINILHSTIRELFNSREVIISSLQCKVLPDIYVSFFYVLLNEYQDIF